MEKGRGSISIIVPQEGCCYGDTSCPGKKMNILIIDDEKTILKRGIFPAYGNGAGDGKN